MLRRRQPVAAGDGVGGAVIVGGRRAVSHSSCTMALPLVRWNTCGVGASMMKIDLPAAL